MTTVISMLRGINLGNRRVKMEDLRALYESLGLENPQTFIQSGNVVFHTKSRAISHVAKRIEEAIEQKFGFHSSILCRTSSEMADVIRRNPFAARKDINPGKLLVVFLSGAPSAVVKDALHKIEADPEELRADGSELYIYFPNGQARPKLNMGLVDKTHGLEWTGRNWNTVMKLMEMAG